MHSLENVQNLKWPHAQNVQATNGALGVFIPKCAILPSRILHSGSYLDIQTAKTLFLSSVVGLIDLTLQTPSSSRRDPTPDVGVFPQLHLPGCVDNSKFGIVSVAFRFGVAAACAPDGAMSTWPCLN